MPTSVSTTEWAARDRGEIERFQASLSAMHDGTNALWQRRVDSAKAGTQIPHLPHSYLFSMECDLYRRTEPDGVEDGRRIIKGVSEPTGESIAMLVIAQSNQEAWAKTRAQMEAHGYDNFLSRIVSKLLCLG